MSTRSCIARKLDGAAVEKARRVAPALYAEHLRRKEARNLLRAASRLRVSDIMRDVLGRDGGRKRGKSRKNTPAPLSVGASRAS